MACPSSRVSCPVFVLTRVHHAARAYRWAASCAQKKYPPRPTKMEAPSPTALAASATDALAATLSALEVSPAKSTYAVAAACEPGSEESIAAAPDAAPAAPVDGTTIDTEFVPGKIFVGGLAWCSTSTSLREHFSKCVAYSASREHELDLRTTWWWEWLCTTCVRRFCALHTSRDAVAHPSPPLRLCAAPGSLKSKAPS